MRGKFIRKFLPVLLVAAVLLAAAAPAPLYAAAGYVKVVLNGVKLDFDVPPVMENNRTLAPLRKISEAIGAVVNWDEKNQTIAAFKGSTSVMLRLGSNTAYINQVPLKLDAPPVIRNGRTLVPLRFFSEAFGATVSWVNETRTVVIDTGEKLSKYIMGYYYSQSYDDFIKNGDKLSSIAAKWYTLDENGDVTGSEPASRGIAVPEGYRDVIKLAKQQGLKIYMLLFENNSSKLEKVLATQESRGMLINQIMTVVEREGYDGVNIDFEYLKSGNRDEFNAFIKELASALRSKEKSLNLSLPAKTEQKDWWPGYDYETLGKYSDFVVLMAYDKNPGNPEPQSGVDWVEQVVDYAIARIPAAKVVLGIGYYGYDWWRSGDSGKYSKYAVLPEKNDVTGKITYSAILFADELVKKYGLKLSLHEKSGMLYGNYTDESGVQHQIWMESDYSVDAKAKMAVRKGLKGIALWRLGYTSASFWKTVNDNFTAAK
jgi:spore germination protein YaaH